MLLIGWASITAVKIERRVCCPQTSVMLTWSVQHSETLQSNACFHLVYDHVLDHVPILQLLDLVTARMWTSSTKLCSTYNYRSHQSAVQQPCFCLVYCFLNPLLPSSPHLDASPGDFFVGGFPEQQHLLFSGHHELLSQLITVISTVTALLFMSMEGDHIW